MHTLHVCVCTFLCMCCTFNLQWLIIGTMFQVRRRSSLKISICFIMLCSLTETYAKMFERKKSAMEQIYLCGIVTYVSHKQIKKIS